MGRALCLPSRPPQRQDLPCIHCLPPPFLPFSPFQLISHGLCFCFGGSWTLSLSQECTLPR